MPEKQTEVHLLSIFRLFCGFFAGSDRLIVSSRGFGPPIRFSVQSLCTLQARPKIRSVARDIQRVIKTNVKKYVKKIFLPMENIPSMSHH